MRETVFLRFADAAKALDAFRLITGAEAEGLSDVPSMVEVGGFTIFVDVLFGTGTIMRPTGETVTDAEGIITPVMAARPGFHVNLSLPEGAVLPDALAGYRQTPENPACVFFGDTP